MIIEAEIHIGLKKAQRAFSREYKTEGTCSKCQQPAELIIHEGPPFGDMDTWLIGTRCCKVCLKEGP